MTKVTGKLVRWRLRLFDIDSKVVQPAGFKYQAANALFRLPTTGMDRFPPKHEVPVMMITEVQTEGGKNETDKMNSAKSPR